MNHEFSLNLSCCHRNRPDRMMTNSKLSWAWVLIAIKFMYKMDLMLGIRIWNCFVAAFAQLSTCLPLLCIALNTAKFWWSKTDFQIENRKLNQSIVCSIEILVLILFSFYFKIPNSIRFTFALISFNIIIIIISAIKWLMILLSFIWAWHQCVWFIEEYISNEINWKSDSHSHL